MKISSHDVERMCSLMVQETEKAIVGKTDVIKLAVLSLVCNGHLLIEDIPGVGKTTLSKALARTLGGEFRRVQFTPDLLPADITGSSIYNQGTSRFEFVPGPIFANLVLIDEINRATPKTQSALLEAMEERQVTTDGVSRELPRPFFVIATQNTIEMTGTYPLPEAQLDRFLLRLSMGYPSREAELDMLDRQQVSGNLDSVNQIMQLEQMLEIQAAIREITVRDAVREYVVALVRTTRDDPRFHMGASPRGSLYLMRASQAHAAMRGQTFVEPDDVKAVAAAVLSHRLIPRADIRRKEDVETVIRELIRSVPVPTISSVVN